jgi:hypothetical protein
MSQYPVPADAITIGVPHAARITGLSESGIYLLISQKKLETVQVGRRNLIVMDSLRKLLTPSAAA